VDWTNLETLWFILIAVLWIGYFFLEGFDFGVGNLLPFLGRDDAGKRQMINSIGPFWDGNEVWLITAGGATFAAFPEWYATLFSGFYLPLLLILVALIVRGVAFEFRGKHDSPRWRTTWDAAIVVGSVVPSILWGVAFANIVRGVPIDAEGEYTGGFFNLLNGYAILGGLTTLALFTLSGALFLGLRTTDDMRARSANAARMLAPITTVLAAGFIVWTLVDARDLGPLTILCAAAAALLSIGVAILAYRGMDGWGFALQGGVIAAAVSMLFVSLYPNVMPSSTDAAFSLTVFNASSTTYTLTVMTIVALVLTPIVLLYQAWTYHIFRARIGRTSFEAKSPVDLIPGADTEPK
jgi:cytochrome d ubiquinol oxidase subunit II